MLFFYVQLSVQCSRGRNEREGVDSIHPECDLSFINQSKSHFFLHSRRRRSSPTGERSRRPLVSVPTAVGSPASRFVLTLVSVFRETDEAPPPPNRLLPGPHPAPRGPPGVPALLHLHPAESRHLAGAQESPHLPKGHHC